MKRAGSFMAAGAAAWMFVTLPAAGWNPKEGFLPPSVREIGAHASAARHPASREKVPEPPRGIAPGEPLQPWTVGAGRVVISLDGWWQISQGSMERPEETFSRKVPVPGLADLARPAFRDVGTPSPLRRAFWYRRTFVLPKRPWQAAILKINKAQFGTRVWVNNIEVGVHWGCCTPGVFDVRRALKWGRSNVIVVRVGADRAAVPPWVPTNTDFEQAKWIPGIYDDVALILSGTPHISSVQIAPHIRSSTAFVQIALRNDAPVAVPATLKIRLWEWRKNKPVGLPVAQTVRVSPGATRTLLIPVKVPKEHLWSPEDPFLYRAQCVVRAAGRVCDEVSVRFGMREFRYDPASGRALLNGKPYFLRGTNFCMFRFFEDPQRGTLPWNRRWVRKLLALPRQKLHWNSARVCIAPFPEFWYDIADELGWLLQDEFPIWGFHDEWSQEELQNEFREWLHERWNHPSIVVWDACNETLTPRTGMLIAATRPLDLSKRPWDNGYSPRQLPSDPMEIHPYLFLGQAVPWDPSALGRVEDRAVPLLKPPFVINEYDALWLQRNGEPATGYKGFYDAMLGPHASPDARRMLLAYTGAALTEYWRARREAAGVQWFCYLTYSRPGGVTSDNFLDLRRLVLEPHFVDYLRNAFDPLGVYLDNYRAYEVAGSDRSAEILLTNDADRPVRGRVRILVGRSDRLSEGRPAGPAVPFVVDAWGQKRVRISMRMPSQAGTWWMMVCAEPQGRERVLCRRKLQVVSAEEAPKVISMALGRPAVASSEIHDGRGTFPARYGCDGCRSTRWSSEFRDPQWFAVDLGSPRTVGRVVLYWEAAYGAAYSIQVSEDGQRWREVYRTENGRGGREEIRFAPVKARWVRLYGWKRATPYGYSLWEFEVFEE
ncbi:MAG: glycoside hydrolase family 2 protein [Chthonomonadales bacterium]